MGNCCKLNGKQSRKFTKMIDSNIAGFIDIISDTGVRIKIQYCGNIPLLGLKEKIKEQHPDFEFQGKHFLKNNLPILDETATLSQLGILKGDTLLLRISEDEVESQDIIISEPESTNARPNLNNEEISLKDSMNTRNSKLSPKKSAQELWRTVRPIPQTTKLINREAIEASSLSNITHGSFQPLTSSLQVGFVQPFEFTLTENHCLNNIFRN